MADKSGWDLLIFRQIDRANKTMSGDLENATVESYQDYIHRAYAAVSALQANVESQIDGSIEFEDEAATNSKYRDTPARDQLKTLRKRYRRILTVAEEENLIQENLVDLDTTEL